MIPSASLVMYSVREVLRFYNGVPTYSYLWALQKHSGDTTKFRHFAKKAKRLTFVLHKDVLRVTKHELQLWKYAN